MPRRAILALGLVAAIAIAAFSKGSTIPLIASFGPVTGPGVNGVTYVNNPAGNVNVYLSSNQTLVVMTYNSGQTITLNFDTSSPAWQASGLPSTVAAEFDLNGINYYGTFTGITVGNVAQLKTDLMLHYNGSTWDLVYPSLAVQRTSDTTWLISSEQTDIPYPAIASSSASLQVARKRSNTNYGNVNMPIHFTITLQ